MAGCKKEEMGDDAVTPESNGQGEENDNTSDEYNMLDSQLDELSTALDYLEEKNDTIHAQLVELLKSSREVRKEIQEQKSAGDDNAATETK